VGAALWVLAGLGAFGLARLIAAGRLRPWALEAAVAIVAAGVAGLTATLLDFGGWKEPGWRAGTFAFLVAAAAVGVARMAGLLATSRTRS
jgi:hypothetical protein